MAGPWFRAVEQLGFELGKAIGKRAVKDVKVTQKAFDFPLAEKISDLGRDAGLSPSYVKDMIEEAGRREDLSAIRAYLNDPGKVYNLQPGVQQKLLSMIDQKVEIIRMNAAVDRLVRYLVDHWDEVM